MSSMSQIHGPLSQDFQDVLASMHATQPQADAQGKLQPLDDTTRISPEEGMALFRLALQTKATATLEIGLAYGFSTVYLLAALEHNGGGTHVAVDPYQFTDWDGVGLTTAQRLVAGSPVLGPDAFRFMAVRSEHALVDLDRCQSRFGLTFIDGYHRFDDVLVDFTLAARLCPRGAVIVMHDMWLDSIATVAAFLRRNRPDFMEVDTGCDNLLAMRRVGADDRNWDHFVPFA